MAPCQLCPSSTRRRALLKRPKTGQAVCKECFFAVFEEEIHLAILGSRLFRRGEKIGLAASGGKDSTVLIHIMDLLNRRHDYGLDLRLISVDEGINGYRDASLTTVLHNARQYNLPLHIFSYKDLYQGWTMDRVVEQTGHKGNCTFCGVFRRQALDRGGLTLGVDHLVTGHNADDMAETVLMNVMRGDVARLERSMVAITGGLTSGVDTVRRSKPFKYTYEKEIVLYAYFNRLEYHSTECVYSPTAYRGHARAFVKNLEAVRPSAILDVIYSGEAMATAIRRDTRRPTQRLHFRRNAKTSFLAEEDGQKSATNVAFCRVAHCVNHACFWKS